MGLLSLSRPRVHVSALWNYFNYIIMVPKSVKMFPNQLLISRFLLHVYQKTWETYAKRFRVSSLPFWKLSAVTLQNSLHCQYKQKHHTSHRSQLQHTDRKSLSYSDSFQSFCVSCPLVVKIYDVLSKLFTAFSQETFVFCSCSFHSFEPGEKSVSSSSVHRWRFNIKLCRQFFLPGPCWPNVIKPTRMHMRMIQDLISPLMKDPGNLEPVKQTLVHLSFGASALLG